jgi:hypothetical protein
MPASEADFLERLGSMEHKVNYMDGVMRKRGSALLFMGALFGMFGFFFAFVTGFMKFLMASDDYPSGNGYFPSTVSEMVADPTDPAGKAFFAFEFVGAIFIFMSWYPWELRNVYIGDEDKPCCDVSWTMFRQFLPAPGMMLVATVTTTPIQIATPRDYFTIFIHLCGAMMMFVGFALVEMKVLGVGLSPPSVATHIRPEERKWREFFLIGIFANYTGFLVIQVVLGIPGMDSYTCCNDVFVEVPGIHGLTLVDTAHSWLFILKLLSYVAEVVCGWSLIMSHLTIWYYSSERNIDLDEPLQDK